MFEVASQIVICLILAALIGGIIGYLLGKGTCAEKSKCNEGPIGTHELHIDQQNKTSNEDTQANSLLETDTNGIATGKKNHLSSEENIATQPILLSSARDGQKDNLQLIKGVGTVLEEALNELGIYHFDQIANLSQEEALWLDQSISFPGRVERENWIPQSKALEAGIQTEFSQRVERGEVASSKKSD
jgi:predicted flap endonuclease-1-like 5' DNA nuclease